MRVMLKRVTIPSHPPPPTQNIPPPTLTHKKCPPTPTHPKYTSNPNTMGEWCSSLKVNILIFIAYSIVLRKDYQFQRKAMYRSTAPNWAQHQIGHNFLFVSL